MHVPFFKHNVGKKELKELEKVFKSPFLTTGEQVVKFEKQFAKQFNYQAHTVGTTSCTAALHLALQANRIDEGDEVITTPLSFVATANAILYVKAKPIFVDVEPETGNINANLIENSITPRTKAILPVHLYGHMADMKKIKEISEKHNLVIIEDAAHCIEGTRDDLRPGQISDAACFSFHAIKTITCGEGGAIITNNEKLAKQLKCLRLHGITESMLERHKASSKQEMTMLGWKYNMSNIQAAMLLPQLKLLKKRLKLRDNLIKLYEKLLAGCEDIKLFKVLPETKSARSVFAIMINEDRREKIMQYLKGCKIKTIRSFTPIHLMPYYQELGYKKESYPEAEKIWKKTILLPLYSGLEEKKVNYVCQKIKDALTKA